MVREQTIEIARLYHGERLSAAEILERLPDRLRPSSARTVYRRLSEASRYVDVSVIPKDRPTPIPAVHQDPDLARTLAAELRLADVLVLESSVRDADDDMAQERLGMLAAEYVSGQVGDFDIIGVGPGRGVWHCINALERQERPQKLNGLRVVSLAGAVALWGPLARLDADANADQLARILGLSSTSIRTTNLPLSILQLSAKHRKAIVEEIAPQLADHRWEQDEVPWDRPPGILIVGLGVLAPGHWMSGRPGIPHRGIEEHLVELRRDYLDSVSVADVGFNLIPTRDLIRKQQPREALVRLLAKINAQTFNVSVEKLNASRTRMLIAGGPKKRAGHVLALGDPGFPFRATCLVTDDVTARAVLEYVREVRHQI